MKGILIACILLVLAAVCIVPAAAETFDESGYGGVWVQDAGASMSALYGGHAYDPADFTIAASGRGLSSEDLFNASNATLNNYTALFGKIAAPMALPENASSAFPVSKGCVCISPVILGENEKLAAYGFRVLPTGQTMTYAYTLTTGAGDTAYAAAEKNLNEWMNTVNEMTNVTNASIVSGAAGTAPIPDPWWISSRSDEKNYGEFGKVQLHSDWYWVSGEQDHDNDYFYTTAGIMMSPGKVTSDNFYKNYQFTLTIDPGYSNLSGNTSHLPGVSVPAYAPSGASSGESVKCSLGSSPDSFSWTTPIPDASFVFDQPAGEIHKWVGTLNHRGNWAEQTFVFKAGAKIVSSELESRNGTTYIISKNTVDTHNAFFNGLFSFGPTTERYISQEMHIRWDDGAYRAIGLAP